MPVYRHHLLPKTSSHVRIQIPFFKGRGGGLGVTCKGVVDSEVSMLIFGQYTM